MSSLRSDNEIFKEDEEWMEAKIEKLEAFRALFNGVKEDSYNECRR